MKKLFSTLLVLLIISTSLSALQVHKGELESAKDTTIEFINYNGPHKKIETVEAIKGIGKDLGKVVNKNGISTNTTTGNKAKYQVIHAVDPTTEKNLDADILILGKDAQVDHIKNLRRIIAAYLSEAYQYSEADADTLSVFITVYNAVYRGKTDYFTSKYKEIVTKNLTANSGLSVNYEEWAGKSEIVIPLSDLVNGGLSTVDTSIISDSSVVSSMKEDDDKNIESRKGMVDIKEREAEEAQTKANEAQKTAAEEQKKLIEEKEKTAQAEKEAAQAEKEAEEAKKEASENPDDEEAQKKAEEAQKKADEARDAAEQQKIIEDEQKAKTEEAKDEAHKQQEKADKKETEAQNERKDIARDQSELQKADADNAKAEKEYGLILVDENNLYSRLVQFNKANGETIKNSPVSQIRNRTVYKTDAGFLAIAGENKGNGSVKLVVLDPASMEITAESNEVIAENSVLVQDGTDYYCVFAQDNSWKVGKYNDKLELKLQSTIYVKAATPIVITGTGIVITDENGKMVVLSKDKLDPLK